MLGAVAIFVLLVHLRDACTVCRCAMIAMFVTNPQEGCNLGSVVGGAAEWSYGTCRKGIQYPQWYSTYIPGGCPGCGATLLQV
mmetsp:Transcript_56449/g.99735  ORF Transcript_56449/g.99735 Transcript_56449/m.99735 type:complete len:83 (+) Transcript_56449:201-449(+)